MTVIATLTKPSFDNRFYATTGSVFKLWVVVTQYKNVFHKVCRKSFSQHLIGWGLFASLSFNMQKHIHCLEFFVSHRWHL